MSEAPAAPLAAVEPRERLSTLFETHCNRLYRLARRLAASPEDAADLVQETFLRAAGAVSSIPVEPAGEEAWLVRVLLNIRRDQWRRERVRQRHVVDSGPAPHGRNDPENSLVARAAVWRAMDRLAPRRRAVVVMAEIDGLPVSAIASLLGVSAVTVRWHLSRGRRQLAQALSFMPGAHDAHHAHEPLAGRGPRPARTSAGQRRA